MNKHLEDLIRVASYDIQIDELGPKIKKVRSELDEKLKLEGQILKNIENLKQECHAITLEISRHDLNIQEASTKLEQIAKKQKEVKTEKEMRALDVESDIARENMTHSNSEIERLEALKISKEEESKSYVPQLEELKSTIATLEEQTQAQVLEIKKIQQDLFDKKESLIAQMDSKITGFYAKIRRWAGNTSVVPLFKQACGGCFMKLNDTTYNEVLKSHDIINCPHCGRILYSGNKIQAQKQEA